MPYTPAEVFRWFNCVYIGDSSFSFLLHRSTLSYIILRANCTACTAVFPVSSQSHTHYGGISYGRSSDSSEAEKDHLRS